MLLGCPFETEFLRGGRLLEKRQWWACCRGCFPRRDTRKERRIVFESIFLTEQEGGDTVSELSCFRSPDMASLSTDSLFHSTDPPAPSRPFCPLFFLLQQGARVGRRRSSRRRHGCHLRGEGRCRNGLFPLRAKLPVYQGEVGCCEWRSATMASEKGHCMGGGRQQWGEGVGNDRIDGCSDVRLVAASGCLLEEWRAGLAVRQRARKIC